MRREKTRSHSDLDMWNRLAPYVLRLFGRHGPSPVNGIGIEACHLNIVRLLSSVSNHIFVFSILLSSYQNQMLFRNRVEIWVILFYHPSASYVGYLAEIASNGTRQSIPYRKVVRAIEN